MKRYTFILALITLVVIAPACNVARYGLNTAQGITKDARIYATTDGAFKQNANLEWAYIDGSGRYEIGILFDGAKVVHFAGDGAIRKAWRLTWATGEKKPKIEEVEFDAAFAVLGDPPGAE